MQVQIRIPKKGQTGFFLNVPRDETVYRFRQMVKETVGVPINAFLLIALGKILQDNCANKEPAKLYSTYRVRDQTCVFVHFVQQQENAKPEPKRKAKPRQRFRPNKRKRKVETEATTDGSKSRPPAKKRKRTRRSRLSRKAPASTESEPAQIIKSMDTVSLPYGDFVCSVCNNSKRKKKCIECGCSKCHLKTGDPLICDQCDNYWHLECAGLLRTPSEQYWYCPECFNYDRKVIIGKTGKVSASTQYKAYRLGTPQEHIIVPKHHVGKVPGIYCGQTWEDNKTLNSWEVHRGYLSSVNGSKRVGSVSLVLHNASGKESDLGYEFVVSYRNADDTQSLKGTNYHMALSCHAPLNPQIGARAIDWRRSSPIRVFRSSTYGRTFPEFAPKEGIRYDGLYKIVKYWPDHEDGVASWKFLLRRDDIEPPPWSEAGKKLMGRQGLRMIHNNEQDTEQLVRYRLPYEIKKMILRDVKNKRLWNQILDMDFWSHYDFLRYVFGVAFVCCSNACSRPIKDPVVIPCGHICCEQCLRKSSDSRCFTCRTPIPPNPPVDDQLVEILERLNPLYNNLEEKERSLLPSDEALDEKWETKPSFTKNMFKRPKIKIVIEKCKDGIPIKKESVI